MNYKLDYNILLFWVSHLFSHDCECKSVIVLFMLSLLQNVVILVGVVVVKVMLLEIRVEGLETGDTGTGVMESKHNHTTLQQ